MGDVNAIDSGLVVVRNGDEVVLTDVETGIAGAGATVVDARDDLARVEAEHLAMLESHPDHELTGRLCAVRAVLRERRARTAAGHV